MFKSNRRVGALAATQARPRARTPRREERVEVTRAASLCIDGAELMVAVTIRDINSGGARLSIVTQQPIPDEVLLIARSIDLTARGRIVWRRQQELGMKFTSRGDEVRLRDLQARYHHNRMAEAARQAQMQQRMAQASSQSQAQIMAQMADGPIQLGVCEGQGFADANPEARQLLLLGLEPGRAYTLDDLKGAYRRQAMAAHPDRGGDPDQFQAIADAFQGLCTAMIARAGMPAPQPA